MRSGPTAGSPRSRLPTRKTLTRARRRVGSAGGGAEAIRVRRSGVSTLYGYWIWGGPVVGAARCPSLAHRASRSNRPLGWTTTTRPTALEEGSIAPVIGVGDRLVHVDLVLRSPLRGPVKFPFAVTGGSGTDADQPAALDHDGRRQHIGAAQVDRQGPDHQAGRGGDEHDRRTSAAEGIKVLLDPFVQPGPHVLDEVLVGDPFEFHHGDALDVGQADLDQPARSRAGRTGAGARGAGPGGRTSGGSGPGGRGSGRRGTSSCGPGACRRRPRTPRMAVPRNSASPTSSSRYSFAPPTHRPTRADRSRASAASAASAITRTIGSVLLARTCTQRSSHSRRSPSRRSARASGKAAAIRSHSSPTVLHRRCRPQGADTGP